MAGHRILVVDDEPASLRAVRRTLLDDCDVVTANGGAAALEALAAGGVALLISDQRMPDMLGTELLARTAALHPNTIRLLLTGYTEVGTLLDAINAGHVYYYLTKPWEAAELRLVVRRGLERYVVEIERQRLLAEVQRVCAQLRREAEQKGRLLTIAAHELGTPLHVAANALDLLDSTALDAAAQQWLTTAQRNLDWLGRGLAQMMTGGRWRSTGVQLRCSEVDVAALVKQVCDTCTRSLGSRKIELSCECATQSMRLPADPVWLGRAVSNLVSNAIRFTPDGGKVRVCASASALGLEITVSDTGIGIAESNLECIFEPFSAACGDISLHTSGRLEFGSRGIGLGLAIAKAVVEQHGGSLSVTSGIDCGSIFTIALPMTADGNLAAGQAS